jgi:hypothetical protein
MLTTEAFVGVGDGVAEGSTDGANTGFTSTFLTLGFLTTDLDDGFLTAEYDGTVETNKTEIDNNKTLSLNTLPLVSRYIKYNQ